MSLEPTYQYPERLRANGRGIDPVFDDDEGREIFDATAWGNEGTRLEDLTEYITQFADRIHFNRYTGVVMK